MISRQEHMNTGYDLVVIGSGPTGLGAAFHYLANRPKGRVLMLDRNKFSSGGLRNDCKMNFTYPVGFTSEYWTREIAEYYLNLVMLKLQPAIMEKSNVSVYTQRAARLGVELLDIRQTHLGTDGGVRLIKQLVAELEGLGAEIGLEEAMISLDADKRVVLTDRREVHYEHLLVAPGRGGFRFLQDLMRTIGVHFIDNVVDIGVRVETRREHYPIVDDYYDPKFHFPAKVRTFCTNSGSAYVVKEKYDSPQGRHFFSVNGHSYSDTTRHSGLVNFAMLKTVGLTEPLASGQEFAEMLGMQAMLLGGGQPIMQRVGDFRLAKRSMSDSFTGDLCDLEVLKATGYDCAGHSASEYDSVLSGNQALCEQADVQGSAFPGAGRHLYGGRRSRNQPRHHGGVGQRYPCGGRHAGIKKEARTC